jgi:RimJ/RimL family protein N-acetyltransferase
MGKFIRLALKNTKIKTCQLLNYKVAKEEHIITFLNKYQRNKQISKRMILTLMEYSISRKRFNSRILTNLAAP